MLRSTVIFIEIRFTIKTSYSLHNIHRLKQYNYEIIALQQCRYNINYPSNLGFRWRLTHNEQLLLLRFVQSS